MRRCRRRRHQTQAANDNEIGGLLGIQTFQEGDGLVGGERRATRRHPRRKRVYDRHRSHGLHGVDEASGLHGCFEEHAYVDPREGERLAHRLHPDG